MSYLGLDWTHEDVNDFLGARGTHGLLQFMAAFVRIIEEVRGRVRWTLCIRLRLLPVLMRAHARRAR